jgi:hypothetical protein
MRETPNSRKEPQTLSQPLNLTTSTTIGKTVLIP